MNGDEKKLVYVTIHPESFEKKRRRRSKLVYVTQPKSFEKKGEED